MPPTNEIIAIATAVKESQEAIDAWPGTTGAAGQSEGGEQAHRGALEANREGLAANQPGLPRHRSASGEMRADRGRGGVGRSPATGCFF